MAHFHGAGQVRRVRGGVYTAVGPRFDLAAPDLATFLDRLLGAVRTFATSGTPPHL